jgi:hypothetical protein
MMGRGVNSFSANTGLLYGRRQLGSGPRPPVIPGLAGFRQDNRVALAQLQATLFEIELSGSVKHISLAKIQLSALISKLGIPGSGDVVVARGDQPAFISHLYWAHPNFRHEIPYATLGTLDQALFAFAENYRSIPTYSS